MSRRTWATRRRCRRGVEGFEEKTKEEPEEASTEEATIPLSNVDPAHAFWVNDGQALYNLADLAKALKGMNENTFKYHVNKEKNDFCNWIRDVIKDDKLAKDLTKTRSKASAYKKVQARLTK